MKLPVLTLLFALTSSCGTVLAADDAHDWLMRMDKASRALNFDGVFIYRHNDKLETMRIIHRVEGGRVHERLVSLTGAPREIIRTDREVQCYLPDENSVVIEHRKAESNGFPGILPQQISDLDRNYSLTLGHAGRVADRDAQFIVVKPKDGYRYGYELWADKATSLLLRADLVDDQGKTVEQFMFTNIQPGANISADDLKPHFGKKSSVWHRSNEDNSTAAPKWTAQRLPAGFKLTTHVMRKSALHNKLTEQLVYSDGLAAVSVFIEKLNPDSRSKPHTTANHMGAVHAFRKTIDDHRVTVVGEVPAATVDLIGQSVKPLP